MKKMISGRTMLETIAVLAVIGILSIAAVMGLTYVKEKNTANQVMKEAVTQAAEIKARKKQFVDDGTLEIKYARSAESIYISSRKYTSNAAGKTTLILSASLNTNDETSLITPEICKKLVSSNPVGIFNCIVTNMEQTDCKNIQDEELDCSAPDAHVFFVTDATTTVVGNTNIDPCANVRCPDDRVCAAGICVCKPPKHEGPNGTCISCGDPMDVCEPTNEQLAMVDVNGCPVWKKMDCDNSDCNLITHECCPKNEIYYKEIEDCCLERKYATTEKKCCIDEETPSNGYCCPSDQTYDLTAGMCCGTPVKANDCDTLVDASNGTCPYYKKNCEDNQCFEGVCCPADKWASADEICCNTGKVSPSGKCCETEDESDECCQSWNDNTTMYVGGKCCSDIAKTEQCCLQTQAKKYSSDGYTINNIKNLIRYVDKKCQCIYGYGKVYDNNMNLTDAERCCNLPAEGTTSKPDHELGAKSVKNGQDVCCPKGKWYGLWNETSKTWGDSVRCCEEGKNQSENCCIGLTMMETNDHTQSGWNKVKKRCTYQNGVCNCQTECSSYKDCTAGYFCDKSTNSTTCTEPKGVCRKATTKTAWTGFEYLTYSGKTTASDNGAMDWWSAQDFCKSLGLTPASAANSCKSNWKTAGIAVCPGFKSGSTKNSFDYWLNEIKTGNQCTAYDVSFNQDIVARIPQYASKDPGDGTDVYALCEGTCETGKVFKNGRCECSWIAPKNFDATTCECMEGYHKTQTLTGTYECWPPCENNDTGLFLLIDTSGSMSENNRSKNMNTSLNSFSIPLEGNTALYSNEVGGCGPKKDSAVILLPYGKHSASEFKLWFQANNNMHCGDGNGTYFTGSLSEVSKYCKNNAKIVVVWWTDAELEQTSTLGSTLNSMAKNCDLKLFFLTPSGNGAKFIKNNLTADKYTFLRFDSNQVTTLVNEAISTQIGCIPTGENPSTVNANYSSENYICNKMYDNNPPRHMIQKQCDVCPNNKVFWSTITAKGVCYTCNRSDALASPQTECNRCSNRFWSTNGKCYNCTSTSDPATSEAECKRCPSRFWIGGNCYNTKPDAVASTSAQCRTSGFFWSDAKTDKCYKCERSDKAKASSTECHRCSNRFWSSDGYCYNCTSKSDPATSEAECKRCPSRFWIGGKCYDTKPDGVASTSAQCRTSGFFWSDAKTDKCYKCETTSKPVASSSECSRCSNRKMSNGKCVKK